LRFGATGDDLLTPAIAGLGGFEGAILCDVLRSRQEKSLRLGKKFFLIE
jgi:hypothetical protein